MGEPAAGSSSDSGAGADASVDELGGEVEEDAGGRTPRKRPRVEADRQAEVTNKAARPQPAVTGAGHAGPASSASGRTHSLPVSGEGGQGPQAAPRSRAARVRKPRKRPARPPAADALIGQAAPRTGVRKPLRAYEPTKLQAVAGAAALQLRPVSAASCAPSDVLFPPFRWLFLPTDAGSGLLEHIIPRPLAFGCARCPAVCTAMRAVHQGAWCSFLSALVQTAQHRELQAGGWPDAGRAAGAAG